MFLTLETLIDGLVATLREDVLPDVATARARSRVWAVVDVLANLRDRVDERAAYTRAEAESATDALRGFAAAMTAAGEPMHAEAIETALEAALEREGEWSERAAVLRSLVVDALARSEEAASGGAEARAALEAHLSAQAVRDVLPLKPSLFEEISKG